jgi:hypothetical protein
MQTQDKEKIFLKLRTFKKKKFKIKIKEKKKKKSRANGVYRSPTKKLINEVINSGTK